MKGWSGSFGTGLGVVALLMSAGAATLFYLGPVWKRQWTTDSALRAGLVRPAEAEAQRAAA